MDKTLQTTAWSCLPKKFKEEVKKMYNGYQPEKIRECLLMLFGIHNLTSDAEGEEEMLYVKRKWVQEMYKNNCDEIRRENISSSDKDCYEYANEVLKTLFGSKCLPDGANSQNLSNLDKIGKDCIVDSSEPKPAEPLSQNPPENCDNGNRISDGNNYSHKSPDTCKCPNNVQKNNTDLGHLSKSSSNFDKQFETILKDSFAKGRRLNVAVQMIKAMIGCPEIVDRISSAETDSLLDDILHDALYLTDKLIAECEKGDDNENN